MAKTFTEEVTAPPQAETKKQRKKQAKREAKIMLKLGLHSLAELIHYAIRHKIMSAPSVSE